jgi:hypothetical protein
MALVMHRLAEEAIMHRFTILAAIAASAIAAGCYGTVGYSARASSGGYGPDLVYAAPGVQVIADYDEPIFFADNLYWRFDGVRWYRSGSYTGGWVYATPPAVVLRIDHPRNYVHYRPRGWVDRRSHPQGPTVRDHREPPVDRRQPGFVAPRREAPPPMRAAPPHRDRPPADKDRDHRPAPHDDDRHDAGHDHHGEESR